ncbi:MAG: hypothetical protein D6679_03070 [Candidatus Hydrogenedentota bacterium]|nr:MAG: hypothetical protein D6679_03070 [Candidatus Hydrogenedentota bacterium]
MGGVTLEKKGTKEGRKAVRAFCPICGTRLAESVCSSCPMHGMLLSRCATEGLCCPECGWKPLPKTFFARCLAGLFRRLGMEVEERGDEERGG